MTRRHKQNATHAGFALRAVMFVLALLLGIALLGARLTYLQVYRYEDFFRRAEKNRTAIEPIVPDRGRILDRNGVLLAVSQPTHTLNIVRGQLNAPVDEVIGELGRIVELSPRDIQRFRRRMQDAGRFDEVRLRSHLSEEEVARFAAQRYRFPGVELDVGLTRRYPMGSTASHVIGYIGRISEADKDRLEEDPEIAANYRGTEYIGKEGVERFYEQLLHGRTGVDLMETVAGGYAVRTLGNLPAEPGQNLVLSIDIRLQRLVEDLFGERRGALVALDPSSGEILALVSSPTFNPNLFVDGIDVENWRALNESPDRPLYNRAIRGTYPAGSTYKPFMALAALEKNLRAPEKTIMDNGSWTLGNHVFRSSGGGGGPGLVDMRRAITVSSNVYFYTLANEMGVDAIHDFMAPLGFGQITGIDLHGEARGVLPSTEWKRSVYTHPEQKKWYPGETISLGIGQGYNAFTILQLAQATATLANGGTRHTPHLLRGIQNHDGILPVSQPEPVLLGYGPQNIAVVREGMVGVTRTGSSRRSFSGAPYDSAGKTGTAQAATVGQKERYNKEKLEEFQRDHALYIAFAPAENPTIALALIVENQGWGGSIAAPIARRVLDYWIEGIYPSEEDIAATRQGATTAPIGTPRRVEDIEVRPQD